ncbi:hypothetical protein EDB92DRAFT_1824470 [Lactarius akahatsu]|uniref:Uncharacterized protein n=1 Tax=Lactarius akahatsu TaxID=416441 RepID=A0AAD4LR43_9AGAM|nr:hypothetical protein EDB92DRAFT_1824470 [Lactarius akahatsu]
MSEAREQLAAELALSTDVFSVRPFAKPKAGLTEDDRVGTTSRAAEATTLSETGSPTSSAVRPAEPTQVTVNDVSTDRELRRARQGVCSCKNGISGRSYHEPYNDKQPVTRSPLVPGTMWKSVGRSQALVTQTQCPPLVASACGP